MGLRYRIADATHLSLLRAQHLLLRPSSNLLTSHAGAFIDGADRSRRPEEACFDGGALLLYGSLNPRHTRRGLEQLRAAQRALAKKRRGSKNREKARARVARLHQKTANQRRDFLHQTSARLMAFLAVLVTEALGIKAMTDGSNPRKRATDVAGSGRKRWQNGGIPVLAG